MAKTKTIRYPSGFRPKKGLGQHFIVDNEIVLDIIDRGGFQSGDTVLEIGPGKGSLTFPLARRVQNVIAVEKDPELVEILEKRIARECMENVQIVGEDILRLSIDNFYRPDRGRLRIVGNLPYNISSPVIEKVIQHRNIISNAVFMFQYEFARRLTAKPGGREYGALSAIIQYYSTVTQLFHVPRQAFVPKPKVGSMVVYIDMEKPHDRRADDEMHYRKVVKAAFAHKRKTILNSLKNEFKQLTSREIREVLVKSSIDPGRRAETVSIDEFIELSAVLNNNIAEKR